jgi:hypothetical protein
MGQLSHISKGTLYSTFNLLPLEKENRQNGSSIITGIIRLSRKKTKDECRFMLS